MSKSSSGVGAREKPMTFSEAEKAARKTVQSKLRAGIYTMPPMEYLRSSDQFRSEIEREIEQQMTAHHGVPISGENTRDLPGELSEEFWAYFRLAWEKFEPTRREIDKAEREKQLERQAERNRDRPSRWWRSVGGFHEVAVRDDGSLWNPNNYPEADVRAAIAGAKARRAESKQKSIRQAVETRARRREQRIWQAADAIRNGAGIGQRDDCYCCAKTLTDPISIERGIGPECWEHVLRAVERKLLDDDKTIERIEGQYLASIDPGEPY